MWSSYTGARAEIERREKDQKQYIERNIRRHARDDKGYLS
jgi:hypothetical protein